MIGKNQRAQGASQTLADGPVGKRTSQKSLAASKNASSSENSKIAPLHGDKAGLKNLPAFEKAGKIHSNTSENANVKALPILGESKVQNPELKKAGKEDREFGRQLSMNNWEADGKTLVL